MWHPLLRPGLTLLHGQRRHLRVFHQELAHDALHGQSRSVLWCDGDHGFNPYDFAERNIEAGRQADDGADRMLIKRCMTPFQWDTVLTQHLPQKLLEVDASLVMVAPFDRLYSTDELQDWEQEDYVRYALRSLKNTARRHRVPVVLSVDMGRWWQTHPTLAQMTYQEVTSRWSITLPGGRPMATSEVGDTVDPYLRRQVTLWDFESRVPVLQHPF